MESNRQRAEVRGWLGYGKSRGERGEFMGRAWVVGLQSQGSHCEAAAVTAAVMLESRGTHLPEHTHRATCTAVFADGAAHLSFVNKLFTETKREHHPHICPLSLSLFVSLTCPG